MDFLRSASNPWDQNVLVGIAWDLMWAAVIVGVVFVVGHAVYVRWLEPKGAAAASAGVTDTGIPDRVVRHGVGARLFHWLMSLAMFVLLITAFVPVIGIQFPWVTIHWIAGIALLLTVIYHIVHAVFFQDLRSMAVGPAEVKEGTEKVRGFFKRAAPSHDKTGKYPLDHKLYHHAVTAVTIGAIVTGLLMMARVDTPFWDQNPYLLSDQLWGIVYVLHGVCGVALITMIVAHVYFAVRPEKLWMTRSMIKGWITRREFQAHHDPTRWVVSGDVTPPALGVAGSLDIRDGTPQGKQPVS